MSDTRDKDRKLPDFEPLQQDISLARLSRSRHGDEQSVDREPVDTAIGNVRAAAGTAAKPMLEERRKERRKESVRADKEDKGDTKGHKPARRSKSVKWLVRLAIIPMLCILTLFAGMIAGYVVLGKGSFNEALNLNTWTHLFQLVFA
ncbi:DNA-directed RNA polymerase subunit beta [Paenibacillus apiarius]|uniref:DNA-directed RNA polymerase subunit beta n=1 Tax=Paenibacillus apiarius TaxID=46240 RepID=A0ABT4DSK1_9BACL|nr:DNA-directed RNA polymerase subunit beta [Paenibacillus apiarius]MBN3523901.1 DNA-directed RNA polymerase subunit beta [Paenibacillus apiarius]MCY9514214.1 DNA-directed RNA polymerase subunit beta [Paenibacillus apiarius]MCY9520337.1 DNA-directed RNA polymerase subunit beta [Paenibacillus apiarius]MCY9554766.1 DNA-directed RNA polymerase subunit beta [Paenibacillus apiarius]MCY9557383.1 DNA-directed RNA polymerase subunit beta [Paenibacillus apiarius]